MTHSYTSVKNAIVSGEICLHYQPICKLSTGAIVGYEALARWGAMPPPAIAALVELHSLELVWIRRQLNDIDAVLAQVYPPTWCSININQRTLALESLPHLLNTSPHALGVHIEILESVQLTPKAVAAIAAISHRHILKADDIGSVEYGWIDRIVGNHAQLFHGLKLCRSLTQNILKDQRTATACEMFVKFAKGYGLEVTAEWVETLAQAELLKGWGCDMGQGALFGLAKPWG